MKVTAIIPARMASTRFPGKPLKKILGLSMVEHVRRRTELSSVIDDVIVATCDQIIMEEVERFGGNAVKTSEAHQRCTDRIAEAAANIDADIIVNVQGDEPLLQPEMFETIIAPLLNEKNLVCSNMVSVISNEKDYISKDVVKVVCDLKKNIIYLSRKPIPFIRKFNETNHPIYKQLGLIAFRKDFLTYFTQLPPTPLEKTELVDMLRIIEHGYKIRMVKYRSETVGVDTPLDLEKVKILMKSDPLVSKYFK